ncbi:MAG TPA: methylmalonyl Co-A mutase-associated GTPase MeaB [Acidobacteriaceae bacterium]|nr:methylmalonyl Co-A mutase-associated GTPase MeaB [Acidobacteriaceae bacterium]
MASVTSTQTVPLEEAENLVTSLRGGNVRALARAISLVENDAPGAASVLSACFPFTGHALRIGVTGSPGSGKSTLVDRLASHYRAQQETVGIVAVDPTSPFTGGAILGDRIRMQRHHDDPGLYIRSMATRGFLGGLASTTADIASVVEASGKTRLLIETVGVGQDEVDIVRLADVTVVVLVPGLGDDVQSIKAGILEIADIFVVNKSDREGADRVEREIRAMQSLGGHAAGWVPPIVRTVATTGDGTVALAEAVEHCAEWLRRTGRLEQKRVAAWQKRLIDMIRQKLVRELVHHRLGISELEAHARIVAARGEDPYRLVDRLVRGLLDLHKDDRQHPSIEG